MSIYKSILPCCFFLLLSCTQAEHIEQKTQAQSKHTDTASKAKPKNKNLLILINEKYKTIENPINFSAYRIEELLKATEANSIQCKDSHEKAVTDSQEFIDGTSISFWNLSDDRLEHEEKKKLHDEVNYLSQEKRMEIKNLEPRYLILNAYSLKKQEKYPIKENKLGEVYVSHDNKQFKIKFLDGTSAHIEVFKDITHYSTDSIDENGNVKAAENHLSNAPEYSPYYFHFWFDGDREKQTCRLKYNVFVD